MKREGALFRWIAFVDMDVHQSGGRNAVGPVVDEDAHGRQIVGEAERVPAEHASSFSP